MMNLYKHAQKTWGLAVDIILVLCVLALLLACFMAGRQRLSPSRPVMLAARPRALFASDDRLHTP